MCHLIPHSFVSDKILQTSIQFVGNRPEPSGPIQIPTMGIGPKRYNTSLTGSSDFSELSL
jgi:hypothetical protein